MLKIIIDGKERSGKSALTHILKEFLESKGARVDVVSEDGWLGEHFFRSEFDCRNFFKGKSITLFDGSRSATE